MAIISAIIFIYFFIYVFYNLSLSIAGLFPNKIKCGYVINQSKICILIPGYKEDEVILTSTNFALNQNYPDDLFDVFVVADSFKKNTIAELSKTRANIIEVQFEKSTKSKSINKALEAINGNYKLVVILDADNLIRNDFLQKINQYYQNGTESMQARRVAKNLNTKVAILDAISESINNHIYRKGTANLGLSSALIGSGMIFKYEVFKNIMRKIKAVGGFDKELQIELVKLGYKIKYLDDTIVFDEKVETVSHYQNQRRRWMSVQFIYLRKYFIPGFLQLIKGNFDYFNFAIFHNIFLPKFLSISLIGIFSIVYLFFNPVISLLWLGLIFIFFISQLIAIPKKMFPFFLSAITYLPILFYSSIFSFFNLKGANKTFINTNHSKSEIDNNLFQL